MGNFQPLQVVGRGSEPQLEVGEIREICAFRFNKNKYKAERSFVMSFKHRPVV